MDNELGQISLYLSKKGKIFSDLIDVEKMPQVESDSFKVRSFEVGGCHCEFYCHQIKSDLSPPPWLDFINSQLEGGSEINFTISSLRPSGLLLVMKNDRVFAAAFGTRGRSWLKKNLFEPDFGIKVAMNLCGNQEVRQAKSSVHSSTTKMIDRQLSKPSDAFDFGMSETELLSYLSAHHSDDKKVTLQGKNNLTVKVVGDDKINWERLISNLNEYLEAYNSEAYKDLFPNYPNLSPVSEEVKNELDEKLLKLIQVEDFSKIHLAIPEFIPDDEYSFSYSNSDKRENKIFSHISVDDLAKVVFKDISKISLSSLSRKNIYAYSHDQNKILSYKNWSLYECLVAEIADESCYVLSNGEWRKVDDDFYETINNFINKELKEVDISSSYKNIDISCGKLKQNREENFNQKYCDLNPDSIKFDQAKLQIGGGRKDKEFCDIFEIDSQGKGNIIHVKKYGGCTSINYLFSQARFYCESFLVDPKFIEQIRNYIEKSGHLQKNLFLDHIKEIPEEIFGTDYSVGLWLLYDKTKIKPDKNSLPLMAKYELKMTYERLRRVLKFSNVSLSMVPVKVINFTTSK